MSEKSTRPRGSEKYPRLDAKLSHGYRVDPVRTTKADGHLLASDTRVSVL